MSQAILDHVGASSPARKIPMLKPGYVVRVHQKIKEGEKERVQSFEGLVISVSSGSGVNKNFTVRKVVDGVGVEKIFPFQTPTIERVEVLKAGRVRRAKLYFMRERSGKSARLRDGVLGDIEVPTVVMPEPEVVEDVVEEEAPVVEEAPAAEEVAEEAKD